MERLDIVNEEQKNARILVIFCSILSKTKWEEPQFFRYMYVYRYYFICSSVIVCTSQEFKLKTNIL